MQVAEKTVPGAPVRAAAAAPPIVIKNEALGPIHKLTAAGTIVVPFVGTLLAIVDLIEFGIDKVDLSLLIVMFVLTNLGLEFGFHRSIAHKAFKTWPIIQIFFALCASAAGTGRILFWVANHRRHHVHSDRPGDPHSPHVRMGSDGDEKLGLWAGMWHAHFGHILSDHTVNCTLFARDINQNHVLKMINEYYLAIVVLGLLIPAAIGGVAKGTWLGAWEGLLWGGFVRMFLVHQATWSLASFSHRFGPARFATHDKSCNNIWVALATFGSGWQNNHHAFPYSPYLGLQWWEIDMTAWVVSALERLGLVWDVKRPSAAQLANKLLTAERQEEPSEKFSY
jgi:stearoyl-CoA desaturase (delta-9 desaturase)